MTMITDTDKAELESLEKLADELLSELATASSPAEEGDLLKLEKVAERAAKIAFGSGQADLLSEQMHNLIRWTDHLNDISWTKRFRLALRNRPLASPW